MKRFFTYPVFVVLFLSFIGMIVFGATVKYHYKGGKKFQFLQKPVIFFSDVSFNLFQSLKYASFFNPNTPLVCRCK